ncbi:unnamed protein product [Callosobruchus maculatus]|uniref:B-block binding subunit of TFIIIC domain-containing protein n=1 Tax=Callosobruchus maculatus TaxID=64391 RepID=A0A653CFZ8_CALMS|nr:unnamed protein product [Callosobruchus maculatus]
MSEKVATRLQQILDLVNKVKVLEDMTVSIIKHIEDIERLRQCVTQVKFKYFIGAAKKNVKPTEQEQIMEDGLEAPFRQGDVIRSVTDRNTEKSQIVKTSMKIGRLYGVKPKFIRMRIMHEILFYLVKDLPQAARNAVLFKARYSVSMYEIVSRLAFCGLVQFGPQKSKDKEQIFLYVNKTASLYDTSSSESGYNKVTDKEYPQIYFFFMSLADIESYWAQLHSISMKTKLNTRVPGQLVTYTDLSANPSLSKALDFRMPQEASSSDIPIPYKELNKMNRKVYLFKVKPFKPVRIENVHRQPVVDQFRTSKKNSRITRVIVKRIGAKTKVPFTKEEDRLLMMCKAGDMLLGMNSTSTTATVPYAALRDVMHRVSPERSTLAVNFLHPDKLPYTEKNLEEKSPIIFKEAVVDREIAKDCIKSIVLSSLLCPPSPASEMKRVQMISMRRKTKRFRTQIVWQIPYKLSNKYHYLLGAIYDCTTAIDAYQALKLLQQPNETRVIDWTPGLANSVKYGRLLGFSEFFSVWDKVRFKFNVPQSTIILNPDIEDHSALVNEIAVRYQIKIKRMPAFEEDIETPEASLDVDMEANDDTIDRLKSWVSDCMRVERRSPSPEFMVDERQSEGNSPRTTKNDEGDENPEQETIGVEEKTDEKTMKFDYD